MQTQTGYSALLSNVLQRQYSNCICATKYMTNLNVKTPPVDNNENCCQFGPYCQFSPDRTNNQTSCTCNSECICSPIVQQPSMARIDKCDKQMCICEGVCLCKSDESLLNENIYRSPSSCNKAKCICNLCLCRPTSSPSNVLPNQLRNIVKKEAYKLFSDEKMEQECAEIKQLLTDHNENKKKEFDSNKSPSVTEKNVNKPPMQKPVSINENAIVSKPPSISKEEEKKSVVTNINEPKSNSPKASIQSPITPILKHPTREGKVSKKKKIAKSKTPSTKTNIQYRKRKSSVKPKPLRIRYYYSGGTEHYGVKLGHQDCYAGFEPVPKHMGWLWNVYDHTKGIRERKGWPPGFIGKSIKTMIQVVKRIQDAKLEKLYGEKSSGNQEQVKILIPKAKKIARFITDVAQTDAEESEDPPILHIKKKGRTYNITFCPKSSDKDIGPVPIPFTIKEKGDIDSDSSDSTLEFELHKSPRRLPKVDTLQQEELFEEPSFINEDSEEVSQPPTAEAPKKKVNKKKSKFFENKPVVWDAPPETQIQNIA